MRYNGVIQRKLALLNSQVLHLEENLRDISMSKFADDWVLRSMAERALQVSVEIMIDVAERILALEKSGPVASAAEAMQSLEQLGVIRTAQTYIEMTRFRNLIVHQYEVIDPSVLYSLATTRLEDFRKFRDEIDAVE